MRWLSLVFVMTVAACGNDPVRDEAGPQVWQSVQASLAPGERPPPVTAKALKTTLTPERMARLGRPVLLTEIPGRGAARMLNMAQNGSVATWQSKDRITLNLRNGLVISTRGFGADLMSAEVGPTLAALKKGGGSAKRQHSYLDGEDQTIWLEFTCQVAREAGGILRETCTGPDEMRFENRYRRNNRGEIVQSEQWLGPEIGVMRLERIDP